MKGVILKYKGLISLDELERMHIEFADDLKTDGFVIVDNRFDIYEVDTEEDENGTE